MLYDPHTVRVVTAMTRLFASRIGSYFFTKSFYLFRKFNLTFIFISAIRKYNKRKRLYFIIEVSYIILKRKGTLV
jgi:hypothetical protein